MPRRYSKSGYQGCRVCSRSSPALLQVSEKFKEVSGIYGIVDTDAWYENRQKFDIHKIEERLVSLHGDARNFFEEMVTPYALRVWE